MPIFKKKIFAQISGKMFQTFHCSNVTTMASLELFLENWYIVPRYIKNVPNIEVCDFIPALSTTLSIKQVIVEYKYIICYFSDVLASDTETTLGDTEDRILRRQRARWVKQKYDRNSIVVVRMKFSKGLKGTKLKGPIMSFLKIKYIHRKYNVITFWAIHKLHWQDFLDFLDFWPLPPSLTS